MYDDRVGIHETEGMDDGQKWRHFQNKRRSYSSHFPEKMDDFNALDFLGTVEAPAIPTGFKNLDDALDGGLREGLYVLGAVPSLGKTTFALQIADYIAKQGRDVLIYSLEMTKIRLTARSI
ncbi:MAG: DnaB helicase C-terminal domain-containing protein, partial [Oscillospiraceae bacterium]|nr:DnaB helicase C-terminal domain-containing protein [Oscillospiraceae bacterium]